MDDSAATRAAGASILAAPADPVLRRYREEAKALLEGPP
jgi:hypothetical protein